MSDKLARKLAILTICGVRGYEQDGVAFLHIEDVARGLGFVETHGEAVCIRWQRVEGYLADLGYSPLVENGGNPHDYYVPENIFYRLCMKARNEVAEAFQAKVADEIIPSIRKTGKYEIKEQKPSYMIEDPETRALAWAEEHRQARLALEAKEAENKQLTLENNNLKAENGVLHQEYVSNKDVCNELLAKGLANKKDGKPYALSTLRSKVSPRLQVLSHENGYSIAEQIVVVEGTERKVPFYHKDVAAMVIEEWHNIN